MLLRAGAQVTGYALQPPTDPSLFEMAQLRDKMTSVTGDIRDLLKLLSVFDKSRPEIVIHMAAQPLVRESYADPVTTFETNVMGTVNVLECVRRTPGVRSFVNVTTDKVYRNKEWSWGYRETDELGGYDPYSGSKSCSELVTWSYMKSFFSKEAGGDGSVCDCAVSSMRAGNVIGGGDFARDRIIPDCVRAAIEGKDIIVRNPDSVRPYEFVLEPVYAYLMLAAMQAENPALAGSYNIGPDDSDNKTTGELTDLFCKCWNRRHASEVTWKNVSDGGPHEAGFLKLDTSLIRSTLGWKPHFNIEQTMDKIVEWTDEWQDGNDIAACMDRQIDEFVRS
jgi:CDP-glucose 4,6-dehydratase